MAGFPAAFRRFLSIVLLLSGAALASAQTTGSAAGVAWLNARQNANGTWGADGDFVPRDTARVLIAQALLKQSNANLTAGLAWLANQRGFEANQFLAEQSVALALSKADATLSLDKLAQQRSNAGPDFGGFIDHTGDSYDSALALQALATNEAKYLTSIAGVVTTLVTRQNPDGGWGIDTGFDSNPVITAEVLTALSSTAAQQAPPATVAAAQAYLAARMSANGSIGVGPLETATAFRALALSGYPLSASATATMAYLTSQQSADGSWGADPYLTARVLEAYASNKPNLAIKSGDFTLSPAEAVEGATVTATVKVSNIGAANAPATTVKIAVGDITGRQLGSVAFAALASGQTRTVTTTFAATQLTGTQTIAAAVGTETTLEEMRKDDNDATATLKVAGKPDLQIFSADILTSPARLQPEQPGSLTVTIRNTGEGEAANVFYAIYRVTGGAETLLKKDAVASIAADGAQVVSIPVTLPAGTHSIRAVADPDAQITESNESNNQATKSISVTASANVDLRIRSTSVLTVPSRPAAGEAFTINATVENSGMEKATSKVAFYDGVPDSGGTLIAVMPVTINAQSQQQLQITHTAGPESRVIYAVADPDDLLPEVDEANNRGYALLTDQFAELVLSREGFVLPRSTLVTPATLTARLVVRNTGVLAANAVQVQVWDDLPQNGGLKVLDTTIDVPALGKTVVPVSWPVRPGQRFATAIVNDGHTIFEPDYANNRVTKLYTPSGQEADVTLLGARATALDASQLVVNPSSLTASGNVRVDVVTLTTRPFSITLFEDIDGDLAFQAGLDMSLGSTLVQPSANVNSQRVVIAAQGTVRFAPGKLALHLDSSNAIAETNERNNFIDVWQDCQVATANPLPGIKWRNNQAAVNLTPVARFKDTNGDDLIDDNDVPYIVTPSRGTIELRRGDTGERLWTRGFGFFNRQLSPAIGDLDGDGVAEILAANFSNKIVALDMAGTTKWTSPDLPTHSDWDQLGFFVDFTYVGAPVIADLDGDGAAEVIVGKTVLNGQTGAIKWVGGGSAGRAFNHSGYDLYFERFPDQEAPIVADLTGDGKLEVIAGSTAYKPDGTILWHRGDLGDGYAGSVYLGSDTTPSIALVAHGRITMLRSDGSTRWGPIALPGGARMGGAPTLFVDGGIQWVGVAGDGYYTVFNATTGVVKWNKATTTNFSHGIITTNAATAHDFGSGMTLAYAARHNFYLLRASDGAILYDLPNNQALYYPTAPVVADIDGDGRTDISVPGADGTKIVSDARWNGTASVFNQLSYNVANVVNDRAQIPAVVTQTPFSKTHFRTNVTQPSTAPITGQPNLTASYMRADTNGFPASAKLTVRAGNNGWFKAIDTTVTFYRVAGTTATVAGTATLRELPPGDYEDVTFVYNNPPADTTAFYAVVDQPAEVAECVETDNKSLSVSVRLTSDITVDPAALLVSDPAPRRGETIELVASADLTSAVDAAKVTAQFYLGNPSAGGTAISAAIPAQLAIDGDRRVATVTTAWNVTAAAGAQQLYVVFDPANVVAEENEANNRASAAIEVGASVGQPDLQVFAADINTTPSRLQPGQQATITATVRNAGKGDASAIGYAIYDVIGSTATLLTRGTIPSLPIGSAQIVSATATLDGGTHSIKVVVDPDRTIAESNETNNEAARAIDVNTVSNVDFRVTSVTATPARPTAGQSITIKAVVENGGTEDGQSKLGLYDGVPGHGGTLIALLTLDLDAQSSATLEQTYTTLAGSVVVYAVADPDDLLPEIDESNNRSYAMLTDSFTDLAVTRTDITLSSANVSAGQTLTADISIRNLGPLAASGVPVVVYDDAPASGGRAVLETTIDVPSSGVATIQASWAARAGQRFATVVVNADAAVFEPNYTNNRATRFYTGSGDEADLSIDTSVARTAAVDTTALAVSSTDLSISGSVKLQLSTPGTKQFTVTIFEDADGDLAYDAEVDSALGSALVQAGVTPQTVDIAVQGTLRFAPGKLAAYIDSSNAVSETDESNNLVDLWQDCRIGGNPRPNLTASYLRVDPSGYPASARFIVRIGNNGFLESAGTAVAFYAVRNGTPALLGRTAVARLQPGAHADVVFTTANPTADIAAVYAVVDDTGTTTLAECNETDNATPHAAVRFTADVAASQAFLFVTDDQPRQGDTIEFTAAATLSGAINASAVTAQFFLGNPALGGQSISGLLPVTQKSSRDAHTVSVTFSWIVAATSGSQPVYVVFDPSNAVGEDDETNNIGIYSLNVGSPEAVRKLAGAISLNPPSSEPNMPVQISAFLRNTGNVALEDVVLRYTVTGGAGTGLEGTATIDTLGKSDYANVIFGDFKPSEVADYTVVLQPADPAVTLLVTPKAIRIAPFGTGELTAAPASVPVSLPLVQTHTKISRGNTIVLPDDPIVPLLRTHIQKGVDWQTGMLNATFATNCFKCHVTAQGLVGLEVSRQVAGITVDDATAQRIFDNTLSAQVAQGGPYGDGRYDWLWPRTTVTLGSWALTFWHDQDAAWPSIQTALIGLLRNQSADGSYPCDECSISYGGTEAMTMMSVYSLGRGFEETHDPKYRDAFIKAVKWLVAYNYGTAHARGPEYAARVSIGLSQALKLMTDPALPELYDEALVASVRTRINAIADFLRSEQNADGSFGSLTTPDQPIIRTAQSLYALSLAGVAGSDPALRNAIVWLLNRQQSNGGWKEMNSDNDQVHWIDETTWAMISLPAAFLRLGQFDVDYDVFVPSGTDVVSSAPEPASTVNVQGGQQLRWRFANVTEAEQELLLNLRLNGIRNNEQRPAVGRATLSYAHPYTGEKKTRELDIPLVTGFAPLKLQIATDQPSYAPNAEVEITEVIENLGTTSVGITNDVVIRDANGLTVATLATNDPVDSLPADPFPAWNYTMPISVPITRSGVGRVVVVPVDFAQKLVQLGVDGTFDTNSIRVTADSAPASELFFHFRADSDTTPAKGKLFITIPDTVPVNTTLAAHVIFDTIENGIKPVSMFDREHVGTTGTPGLIGKYWATNTALTPWWVDEPSQLIPLGGVKATVTITTTHVGSFVPSGVPFDFWFTIWTGSLYAPVSGTYRFGVESDDGAWIDIDGKRVLANPGAHGPTWRESSTYLSAGFHDFKLSFYDLNFGQWMNLSWIRPGQGGWSAINGTYLQHNVPASNEASVVVGAPRLLPHGQATRTYRWNTGITASGSYSVGGLLKQFGTDVTGAAAAFTITPASTLTATIATDKPVYDSGDTVRVNAGADYAQGNTTLTNLNAIVSIADAANAPVASHAVPIASLIPGQSVPANFNWPAGSTPAGTYTAKIVVNDSAGVLMATASVPFEIRSTTETGKGVTGTIAGPAQQYASEPVPFSIAITNGGNAGLTDAPFSVIVLDPASETPAATFDFTASIAAGATHPTDVTWMTTLTTPQKTYDVFLVSRISGTPVPIATAKVEIIEPPFSNMTGTITTDRAAYDCNEEVSITSTVNYVDGNITRRNMTATLTVTAPGGSVVATQSVSEATLAVGGSMNVSLVWPTAASTPGIYTIRLVAANDLLTFVDTTATFEVRSTAVTGKCVSGTLSHEEWVYAGSPMPFAVSLTNSGNAPLSDAPFAVVISDPATQEVVATLDFTASMAMGATHTATISWATTAETKYQVYNARLASKISATPAQLAQSTAEVKEPPYSNMSATVATNAAAYDCNEDVTVTANAVYDKGNVTRSDVTATITIADPSGTTVATISKTAATFAVGDTIAGTLDWATASSVPGTYAVTVTVADAEETYATASSSFEVRSTAVTGKCMSGTLSNEEWVYAGSPVPFAISLNNDGNASLTDAPFALVVTDPATQDVIATLDFTASVAAGASHSTTVTWNTTAETQYQVYAVRLVSKITATPALLAQSAVEVKEPPYSNMSATVATDAAAYDCNEDVTVTAGAVYDKGNVIRSDVTATITIADPSGATVAAITKTAATFAIGDTISATLDWATASSAPGTYAVTVTVADAEETYATASSSFEIRSSAVTGLCISGTIAAPESVTQGEPVPFDVSILNGGNAALATAPFAIVISHPTTDAHVATLTVVVDAATGATFTSEVPWATASVLPQFYTARLVSLITGSAVTLAETTVEVKVPPLKLELSLGAPPRVLIWADCANGNGASNCTPTAPAFITKTLNDAGIPWTLVGDQYSFINALRSGAYDEAILYQRSAYEDKVFAEYLETIRGGTGLLLIKAHSDAMPKLAPALGVTFKGNLNATSTVLELLDTPFTTAGQLSLNGDGVKIELAGAQAAAKVLSTQAAAISYNTFGTGRVVIVPFDLEKTTTEGSAKLLLGAVRYVARTHTFDARRVVAIDFKVTPPPGAPSNLTIAAELPEGMTVVHAMPALTTAEPPSWNVTSDGTELHLYLWVRLPDDGGTYTITGTGAFTGQIAIVTKSLEVEVTADRVALEATLQSALTALVTAAPAKDQKAVADAQTQLNAIKAANPTDNAGFVAVINRVLTLVGNLQSISVDTSAARNAADRVLAWWQSRAGL